MAANTSLSAIQQECREGDHVILEDILSRDASDINSRDQDSKTPVMIAAGNGFKDAFDVLVSKGCDLTQVTSSNSNLLHIACIGGNIDIVNSLLVKDPTLLNRRGHNGKTPVMIAAQHGQREVFRLLADQDADLSLTDSKENTVLHWAAIGGMEDIVEHLLQEGVCEIDERSMTGTTPVMLAARKGHKHIFDKLVNKGCDLSLLDEDCNNVLHHASRGGNVGIVEYILSLHDVDVDAKDKHGLTPLMIAAKKSHGDVFYTLLNRKGTVSESLVRVLHFACVGGSIRIIEHLLALCHADINARGPGGTTPVMTSALMARRDAFDLLVSHDADISSKSIDDNQDNVLHSACRGGNVEIVDYILSLNTDLLNTRGKFGFTPLLLAAGKGHRNVFFVLLTKECDTSGTSEFGDTLLHSACIGGNMEIVEYVLSKNNVDMNSRGQHGATAVMIAAQLAHGEVFFSLADKGCHMTIVDRNKDNLLHHACCGGHVAIVDYLISLDVFDINGYGQQGLTPLMMAAHKGHSRVFDRLLLEKKCDKSLLSRDSMNILHVASMAGSLGIVEKLLAMNCVDISSRGSVFGRTALMLAAEKGHKAVFDLLVSKGCDLAETDTVANNILHFAAIGGNVDIVEYVLSKKIADINTSGQYLRTPVMIAAEYNEREVFNFLVRKGCDLSRVDALGNNILHSACIGGNMHIVKYVLSEKVVDINNRGEDDKTAALIAYEHGHADVSNWLTHLGCKEDSCSLS